MFSNHTNHLTNTAPVPVAFVKRSMQTFEMLTAEFQRIVAEINAKLTPNARYSFEVKHYIDLEFYSKSFAKELKKQITGFYTFHKYNVSWSGSIICVDWIPVTSEVNNNLCCSWMNCNNPASGAVETKLDLSDLSNTNIRPVRSTRANNLVDL